MNNLFLAKSNPKKQTIMEHTDELLKRLKVLKDLYPTIGYMNWDLLQIACIYHDLGKMNTKFQNKLMSDLQRKALLKDPLPLSQEVHHGYLSVAFLPLDTLQFSKDELRVLCQSIYFHHHRPDIQFQIVKEIVNHDLVQYYKEFHYDKTGSLTLQTKYSKYVKKRISSNEREVFNQYIMTKGMLNKLDYTASANIDVEIKNKDLFERTKNYIENQKKGELNDLQHYMVNHQDQNNIVIASTGVGKTEAALLWNGNSKGFFTLPLKVSINAIYDRIKTEIGFQTTGLLHSDTSVEYMKREKEGTFDLVNLEKTKQLSYPLTICTLDQLIDFIMRYPGFELKLSTLAYSKLVIDEIQMYSPKFVAYLLVALKQITDLGGQFSILTATFPPVFEHFMKRLDIPYQKAPKPFYKQKPNGELMIRHRMKVLHKDISIEHIVQNYKSKKVLVIVNTIKKAQEIYQRLKNKLSDENIQMLHSRFTLGDRSEKEQDILEMGRKDSKKTGIWVTTQIVEASLDIDFDVLYTELSEVCGLLQRMGRVYRNRELVENQINVYVYTGNPYTSGINSNTKKSIIDPMLFSLSKEVISQYEDEPIEEKQKIDMVESVYNKQVLQGSDYYQDIHRTIHTYKDVIAYEIDKRSVDLREIDSEMLIPHSVYTSHSETIEEYLTQLKKEKDVKKRLYLHNELKQYTVNVPGYGIKKAAKDHLISHFVELDKFNRIPVIGYVYDEEKGLLFEEDYGMMFS